MSSAEAETSPIIPKTYRALVHTDPTSPLTIQTIPTPPVKAGSCLVRVLTSSIMSYLPDVYAGNRPEFKRAYPTPFVPGMTAIGRIIAVGPDAVSLTPGQLVYVDCVVRGRDDNRIGIVMGLVDMFTDGGRKLASGEWRNGSFAELVRAPLEVVFALDESRLLGSVERGGLGYDVERLTYLSLLIVSFGGLRDVGLGPGETVVMAPTTGGFGAAAVALGLALGARVIAMGRNQEKLKKLKEKLSKAYSADRLEIIPITGDADADAASIQQKAAGPVDVFFDISPGEAQNSSHIKSGIMSLRRGGRVSLMGGIMGEVPIDYGRVMLWDITLKGKWMYEREDVLALIKLLRTGMLKLDFVDVLGRFGLEEWEKAFEVARKSDPVGTVTVIKP